jgi:hypothetical protein
MKRMMRATRTSARNAAPLLHRILHKDLSALEYGRHVLETGAEHPQYGRHVLETGAEHPHQLPETGALELRVPCVW